MNWELNLGDMQTTTKLIYDNMLRLFVNGYVPDYLENPDGIETVPAMIKLGELSNKSMVRCSSKDNEEEFKALCGELATSRRDLLPRRGW